MGLETKLKYYEDKEELVSWELGAALLQKGAAVTSVSKVMAPAQCTRCQNICQYEYDHLVTVETDH